MTPIYVDTDERGTWERTGKSPPMLLRYQRKWLRDRSRVKVFEKSRRIGITWATAAHCVREAARGITDVWYVAYKEDAGKEFIRDCMKWCHAFREPARLCNVEFLMYDDEGRARNVYAMQIVFTSGMRITALTSNPRNLRGKQGLVIIDEAAFHPDLSGLLKAAFALLMWGGQVWILSTHNGADNPFALLCDEIRDGKRDFSLHRVSIVDALADGLFWRICNTAKTAEERAALRAKGEEAWLRDLESQYGADADEELHCNPSQGGEAYLTRDIIDPCMYDAPVVRYDQEAGWEKLTEEKRTSAMAQWCEAELGPLLKLVRADKNYRAFAFGLDFARVSDLTVAAPMGITQAMKRRVPFLLEMRGVPFAQQLQAVRYILKGLPQLTYSCLDAGGNGSWLAEQVWLEFGRDRHVERVSLSLPYYKENMPAFKQAHEEKILQYPRDIDVRRDLSMIRRVNGVPKLSDVRTDENGKTGVKRHGDAAIALFMANTAARIATEKWARLEALSTL